ncbi:aromatic amino acid lyase [Neisseria leonii]|uniref:aromatic amino acid lyase n=1 Tax=Neisseria leonii TaxID=2995413 RepID=UPI00237A39F8|nr:aromatic amino acid lyase [Neisseria sp. 3986]MDD9325057.1 aromatic amino acid ammonia-lyase [Neisseria sp. 3986]
MKKIRIFNIFTVVGILLFSPWSWAQTTVTLDPEKPLTLDTLDQVANRQAQVVLSHTAISNIRAGHAVVMQAALNNKPVYGLTVGVGWNKDKPVFKEEAGTKTLAPELLEMSRQFNVSSLRAHAAGLGQPLPESIVRASMLIRLNTFLKGEAGVSPEVAQQYTLFLNKGITPVVPERGSIGEADITLASHIGLAMTGEWDVFYRGKRMNAAAAMQQAGITPLKPIGKDFLSILSTNALSAAQAAHLLEQSRIFYRREISVFARIERQHCPVQPCGHAGASLS